MAEIKIGYAEQPYRLLMNRDIQIMNFLNVSLFGNIENKHSIDEIKNTLLSYHMEEGGFIEIVDLKIVDANINLVTGNGKVVFEYVLGYSNTCAGTRTDLTKKDSADFRIDTVHSCLILSFLDVETPSPDGEF